MARAVEGTVIAQHGRWVRIRTGERTIVATCRSRLAWEGTPPETPRLVAGDRVLVEERRDRGLVVAARSRHTSLTRRSPKTGRGQLIVANVDQALVVLAARSPAPNRGLLDRFLVACQIAEIEAVVTINKTDQGTGEIAAWMPLYQELGYPTLLTSARDGRGVDAVRDRLRDRTTLLCGPSGVGKSSLLNAVHPGLRLKVGSISESTGKGRHTTSRAELLPLPFGGFVVDTPGLKEFGLWNSSREELTRAFAEIADLAGDCRFADCSHTTEPQCAVMTAVTNGDIDHARYRSYRSMLEEVFPP